MSRLPTFPASYENEHSRLVEHRDGFTVRYEAGGEVVGVLSLNADDDYKLADALLRSHARWRCNKFGASSVVDEFQTST